MIMSWIFTGMVGISLLAAMALGNGSALAAAVPEGAAAGVKLALSMAGTVCLWSGVGNVMEKAGITERLCRFLRPGICFLFPEAKSDTVLESALCGNICANLLGLGNAATPLGLRAAGRLHRGGDCAGDSLCRLIVLNTASLQLLPTNLAAIRVSLGCSTPFDILPAVWLTSFCSLVIGLSAAFLLARVWRA